MKKMIIFSLGVLAAFGILGCAAQTEDSGSGAKAETAYHKIGVEEAKAMMDAGGVIVVDVRTASEYAGEHIPDAVNIPNEEIGKEQPELLPDKEAVLLVYCRSGRRSKEAADKLAEIGYTQVYDFGGILDWNYDTVKGE